MVWYKENIISACMCVCLYTMCSVYGGVVKIINVGYNSVQVDILDYDIIVKVNRNFVILEYSLCSKFKRFISRMAQIILTES